jgi:hypothetical protein
MRRLSARWVWGAEPNQQPLRKAAGFVKNQSKRNSFLGKIRRAATPSSCGMIRAQRKKFTRLGGVQLEQEDRRARPTASAKDADRREKRQ